jgi:hypothetical protein
VDGWRPDGAAGGPAWHCRRVCATLPPSRMSAASGACPVSTSRVHCPSVRTADVRQLRGPGAEPRQVSAAPDTVAGSAVRLGVRPGAGRTAAVHRGHGRAPEQHGDTAAAGRRPPGTPVDCGSGTGRHLPTLPGCPRCLRELRPSGDAVRTAGRRPRSGCPVGCGTGRCMRPLSTAASENRGRCPDGRCPPGTLPQSAGCRLLPEAVAWPAAAGGVPPPPVGVGELAAEPVAQLGAHVGHRRSLQGQGLLGGQPAEPRP